MYVSRRGRHLYDCPSLAFPGNWLLTGINVEAALSGHKPLS